MNRVTNEYLHELTSDINKALRKHGTSVVVDWQRRTTLRTPLRRRGVRFSYELVDIGASTSFAATLTHSKSAFAERLRCVCLGIELEQKGR